jgi:hypothetical protein
MAKKKRARGTRATLAIGHGVTKYLIYTSSSVLFVDLCLLEHGMDYSFIREGCGCYV